MKFAVAVLAIGVIAGCSGNSIPTAPAPTGLAPPIPPAPTSALLWVLVLRETGQCIEGATIQIVAAQGAGEPIPQETPCDAWDTDGGVLLQNLTPGIELTLRGAATGYKPDEKSFLPFPMPGPYRAVFITLSKAQ